MTRHGDGGSEEDTQADAGHEEPHHFCIFLKNQEILLLRYFGLQGTEQPIGNLCTAH